MRCVRYLGHTTTESQAHFQGVKQANAMQNFNPHKITHTQTNINLGGEVTLISPTKIVILYHPLEINPQVLGPRPPIIHPQQKSNLESLMEHFIQTQINTNEVLSEQIN